VPDLIKDLDFCEMEVQRTVYSKGVKSSDSCLRAITLAVVCNIGGNVEASARFCCSNRSSPTPLNFSGLEPQRFITHSG